MDTLPSLIDELNKSQASILLNGVLPLLKGNRDILDIIQSSHEKYLGYCYAL